MMMAAWCSLLFTSLSAPAGVSGRVDVTIHEASSIAPLPCRAWVERGGQRYFQPEGEEATPYGGDQSFSCNGRFSMTLPSGEAVVHIERGKEYVPQKQKIQIAGGQTVKIEIELHRWIDMPARGWYSAEQHNHFGHDDIEVLKQLALADDIHWLPSFTYWNDFHENWPDYAAASPIHRADDRHIISLHNEEVERIGGEPFHSVDALFIFGIDRPLFVPRHDHFFPCSAVLARQAKDASPDCVIDTDKPLWAENVVTMAFGLFDSVQVCHNHYHRLQTLHEGRPCCGMIDDSLEETPHEWNHNELFLRTNMIYYRWLNCGFRLAVSGGSAMGVMAVPPGYNRTYARLEGPLTEESYRQAIHAGRTFATSGPMLFFTVDGQGPGALIERSADSTQPLTVEANVESVEPLETIEIIMGGQVMRTRDLQHRKAAPVLKASLTAEAVPQRSTWVAARVLYRAPDGYLRQAHTSPVYVILDGKPIASKRDAQYMIRWIDRLLEVSETPKRYASPEDRLKTQAIYREARDVYQGIAASAERLWHD